LSTCETSTPTSLRVCFYCVKRSVEHRATNVSSGECETICVIQSQVEYLSLWLLFSSFFLWSIRVCVFFSVNVLRPKPRRKVFGPLFSVLQRRNFFFSLGFSLLEVFCLFFLVFSPFCLFFNLCVS